MKLRKMLIVFSVPFILASCSKTPTPSSSSNNGGASSNSQQTTNSSSSAQGSTSVSSNVISVEENDYEITAAGSYTLTGEMNGSVIINTEKDAEVELILNGATITSYTKAPIHCIGPSELKIKLQSGTTNYVYDRRPLLDEANEDTTQGKGAIYAKSDLKFTGKGSLVVEASYNNGIHTTKSINFKSTSENSSNIKVTAINHAVKGNDQVKIESGKLELIAKCGSGIKTENTDVSSKGNQRGNIIISGGEVDIHSCEDGIEASYNVNINEETSSPKINIFTSKYSSYTQGSMSSDDTSSNEMYLRASSNKYNYAVQFKSDNGATTWVDAPYYTSKLVGRSTAYFYKVQKPSNATMMKLYAFNSSETNKVESTAVLSSTSYIAINSSFDTAVVGASNGGLTCSSWTNFSSTTNPGGGGGFPGGGPGGMQDGNTDKADYSAKGIKADNEIYISGGEINVKAYDDAIHASRGETFDNGETGLGNVSISGGKLTLFASDDGIHADYTNTISGGEIDITNSYEGVEGNLIRISGGYTKIYSTDDGLNAANKAGVSPDITVSGGIVDITVYGGDVDGIDSNNTYTQTGGVVITKGGTGGMSTGLDTDGVTKVTGGSLIVFGKPENTPQLGTGVTSYTLSGSYSIGTYTLANTDHTITVSTKYSYTIVYVYSGESSRYTITKN